jgi:PAS domain S-box-containing protein
VPDAARLALEQRERLLSDLLDVAGDGVVVIDVATRRRVYANRTVLRAVGYDADELTQVPLGAPASEQDAGRLHAAIDAVVHGPDPRRVMEAQVRRRDGRVFPAEFQLTYRPPAVGEAGDGHVILVARDIAARRRLEADRERRAAVSEATSAVQLAVLSGRRVAECLQLICDRAMALLGCTVSGISLDGGDGVHAVVAAVGGHDEPEAVVGQAFRIEGALEEPVLRDGRSLAVDLVPGRLPHPLWMPAGGQGGVLVVPLRDSRGVIGALSVVRGRAGGFNQEDVAILTGFAAQAALAVEYGRLRADRERADLLEERERIARDLHDTVVQDLFATGMLLDATIGRCTEPAVAERISRAVDDLDGAIASLRSVVFLIDPPASSASAAQVLRRVVDARAEPLGFTPVLELSGDPARLPQRVVGELVQVVGEALSNVARHAGATAARVRLTVDELGGWSLEVQDDGSGFRPGRVPLGRGLLNLGTRAELLSASLQIDSEPGGGTRILLRSSPAALARPS